MAWKVKWKVRSHSNRKKEYVVSRDQNGNYGCSCPAWTRRTPRKDCKHIKEVKDGGGVRFHEDSDIRATDSKGQGSRLGAALDELD